MAEGVKEGVRIAISAKKKSNFCGSGGFGISHKFKPQNVFCTRDFVENSPVHFFLLNATICVSSKNTQIVTFQN